MRTGPTRTRHQATPTRRRRLDTTLSKARARTRRSSARVLPLPVLVEAVAAGPEALKNWLRLGAMVRKSGSRRGRSSTIAGRTPSFHGSDVNPLRVVVRARSLRAR